MLKPLVKVRVDDGVLIADFWDCLRLDPAPVLDLRKMFEAHVRKGGKADVVIDLNGVSFAGSAALGGFITLRKFCQANEGRIVFCNVDANVREVFRVSRLEPLFMFTSDLPTALAKLREESAAAGGTTTTGSKTPAPPGEPRIFPPPSLRRRKP